MRMDQVVVGLRGALLSAIVVGAALQPGCSCNGMPGGMGLPDGSPPDGYVLDTDSGAWVPVGDGGQVQVNIDGGVTISDDGGTFTCFPTTCNGKLLECGDCLDNDGDGYVDFRDRECLGPCDNTEGPALTAGIGGETGGPCKADCYFDFGNGPGNDDCHWDHRCDTKEPEVGCGFTQSMVGGKDCPASQSKQCLDFCMPITPNGCDCFGCCTFPELNGGYVWIGAMDSSNNGTCTFDKISDPKACPPCTPVADCSNDCGKCELCLGKTTLPAECFATVPVDGGNFSIDMQPPPRCPAGVQPCGLPGDALCPSPNFYCITGCCQDTTIIK